MQWRLMEYRVLKCSPHANRPRQNGLKAIKCCKKLHIAARSYSAFSFSTPASSSRTEASSNRLCSVAEAMLMQLKQVQPREWVWQSDTYVHISAEDD